jgi:hypothetical protein
LYNKLQILPISCNIKEIFDGKKIGNIEGANGLILVGQSRENKKALRESCRRNAF